MLVTSVASLARTFRAWNRRATMLSAQIVQNHPWAGIVSPSMSNLPLTPAQVRVMECLDEVYT